MSWFNKTLPGINLRVSPIFGKSALLQTFLLKIFPTSSAGLTLTFGGR